MRAFTSREVLQSAATGTGNGSSIDVAGLPVVCLQITGITIATVIFEATVNGTDFVSVMAVNVATGVRAVSASVDGVYRVDSAGYARVRSRISAYTSGAISVTGMATSGGAGEWDSYGSLAVVSAELTRPADTAAYIVGDVLSDSTVASTLLTFASVVRVAGGSGYITKVRLITDQSANVAQFRLWLYTISNPSVVADNVPMALLYANKANRIGYIDLPACSTEMSGSDSSSAMNDTIRFSFRCADVNLYGLFQVKTAFTPASAQKFFIELTVDQDA